jgi:hypothetical protein
MADTYLPLLKAVIAKLKANTAVMGYVSDRVESDVKQNQTFPYIRVAITSTPFDTGTTTGMEHIISVAAFARGDSPLIVAAIRAAAYNVLHRQESGLTLDNGTVFNLNYTQGFTEQEPDGKTWQAKADFRAVVMD